MPGAVNLNGNQTSVCKANGSGPAASAVTLICQSGRIRKINELGIRDPGAHLPMQRDSLFRVPSISKPVVVAAAMAFVDHGKLALSARWILELSDCGCSSIRSVRRRPPSPMAGPSRSKV
ncbi:serine hydrolase [Mycobacterium sp. URHB0021]